MNELLLWTALAISVVTNVILWIGLRREERRSDHLFRRIADFRYPADGTPPPVFRLPPRVIGFPRGSDGR